MALLQLLTQHIHKRNGSSPPVVFVLTPSGSLSVYKFLYILNLKPELFPACTSTCRFNFDKRKMNKILSLQHPVFFSSSCICVFRSPHRIYPDRTRGNPSVRSPLGPRPEIAQKFLRQALRSTLELGVLHRTPT